MDDESLDIAKEAIRLVIELDFSECRTFDEFDAATARYRWSSREP
jgi:hypothetical protein